MTKAKYKPKSKKSVSKSNAKKFQIQKRHIRVSILVCIVIFTTIVVMMLYFSQQNIPVNVDGKIVEVTLTTPTKVFLIGIVSTISAILFGTLEYLYITRVKGY